MSGRLEQYIVKEMRMSHVYQPVMLKTLLENEGEASIEQISAALLSYDQSQIEYYGERVKKMVGRVLTNNGLVDPIMSGTKTTGYKLQAGIETAYESQRLIDLCEHYIQSFLKQKGANLWTHRHHRQAYVSGSTRYNVFKRASYRCELCGAHEHQAALHIDHIIPRSKGGTNDLSNFQALCQSCNTSKRNEDATDFRAIASSYEQRSHDCIFCDGYQDRVIDENELTYAIRDGFPVTEMHTLIIPKRHVADYFDLYQPELNAINQLLSRQRQYILQTDPSVTSFNVGINAGAEAGQTIFHVHVHLIPRRQGDTKNPRGGVRGVIPSKQSY